MNEQEIIGLFLKRDQSAITELENMYGRYCGSIAANILAQREDREECLNDTWLKVWNSIPPTQPNSLKAFAGKITRNLALNRIRAAGAARRGTGQAAESLEELTRDMEPSSDNVEQAFDRYILTRAINAYLAGQSKEKRIIFVRRYFYMDSVQQIAEMTGRREGTIKSVLSRMREDLRKELNIR